MSQQSAVTLNYFDVKSVLGTVRVATESGLHEMVHLCKFKSLDDLPRGVLTVTNRHTGQYENLYLIDLEATPQRDVNIGYSLKELFLPALLQHEVFQQNFLDSTGQFSVTRVGSALEHQVRNLEPFFTQREIKVTDMLVAEYGVTTSGMTYARIHTADFKNQYGSVDMFRAWMTSEMPSAQAFQHHNDGVKFTAEVKYSTADGKTATSTLMYGTTGMQVGANICKFFKTPDEAAQFLANLFMSKFPFLDVSIRFED